MRLTIFILWISQMALAEEICFRPQDMSNSKAVKLYEACREKHEMPKPVDYLTRFPPNVENINPNERCTIFKDGSYKCVQDPIRFVVKEKVREDSMPAPLSTPDSAGEGTVLTPPTVPTNSLVPPVPPIPGK